MKKTVVSIAGTMMLALLLSCGSTKVDSDDIDSYGDETEATAIPLTAKKSSSQKIDSDPYSKSKIKGSFLNSKNSKSMILQMFI